MFQLRLGRPLSGELVQLLLISRHPQGLHLVFQVSDHFSDGFCSTLGSGYGFVSRLLGFALGFLRQPLRFFLRFGRRFIELALFLSAATSFFLVSGLLLCGLFIGCGLGFCRLLSSSSGDRLLLLKLDSQLALCIQLVDFRQDRRRHRLSALLEESGVALQLVETILDANDVVQRRAGDGSGNAIPHPAHEIDGAFNRLDRSGRDGDDSFGKLACCFGSARIFQQGSELRQFG
ncbi:hypothetical protein D9M71_364390 [compost metagenome]